MLALLAVAFYVSLVLDSVVAVRLLGTTLHDIRTEHLTWGLTAGQYISYLPLLAVLLTALPWASRRSLRELGLRGFDRRTVVAGLLGAVAMYAVTLGLANLQFALTHQKPKEAAITLFTSTHDPVLIFAFTVLAVVVAPFMEEFIYRGFLFNALLRYTPVWVAAVMSGALFGLSHVAPDPSGLLSSLSPALPLAGSGVVLAYVYYRTGSLTAAMLTHATFNLLNVALLSAIKS